MSLMIVEKPFRTIVVFLLMVLFNFCFLTFIPGWVGFLSCVLVDFGLCALGDRHYYTYVGSMMFFFSMLALVWVGYWEWPYVAAIFKGGFTVPPIRESLEMLLVMAIMVGLFILGWYYIGQGIQEDRQLEEGL